MDKPVELMNEAEQAEYYMKRRAAILAGDNGVLPNGTTCFEERQKYVALCNADPFRTLPGTAEVHIAANAALEGSELPPAVAPEIAEFSGDNSIDNKRCC